MRVCISPIRRSSWSIISGGSWKTTVQKWSYQQRLLIAFIFTSVLIPNGARGRAV
ncbi:hypothetical protein [Klebsiella phage vB_KpnS-MUC-5]|nr:hypothetical protein [Klebsiella phage vB_KpnS-MUC-5]